MKTLFLSEVFNMDKYFLQHFYQEKSDFINQSKPLQNQITTRNFADMQYQQDKFLSVETFLQVIDLSNRALQFPVLGDENSIDFMLDYCENNIDFFSQCPKDDESSQGRQIQLTELSSRSSKKTKKHGCHCKKTRCLKMYCQCFSQGKICSDDCLCIGCHNDQKYQKSEFKRKKNPQKKQPVITGQFTSCQVIQITKGCSCKKSHCQKRYCQCLNAGIKCSQLCQCVQCNNCLSSAQLIQNKMQNNNAINRNKHNNWCSRSGGVLGNKNYLIYSYQDNYWQKSMGTLRHDFEYQ